MLADSGDFILYKWAVEDRIKDAKQQFCSQCNRMIIATVATELADKMVLAICQLMSSSFLVLFD